MTGSNVARINPNTAVVTQLDGKTLELIRHRIAKNATNDEFDAFIHVCKHMKLDPLRKQIYLQIYSAGDAAKRQMVVVVGIDGYRTIANRTGAYLPGKITFEFDSAKVCPLKNPTGMVKAIAVVKKFMHGAWHECEGEVMYDEFAPITSGGSEGETWEDIPGQFYPKDHPTKPGWAKRKKVVHGDSVERLDPSKDAWKKPHIMLGKCAEATALRRAFPDDFAGTYVAEEMDRAEVLDLTASEIVEQTAEERRAHAVGNINTILVDWMETANSPFDRVPAGQFVDRFFEWLGAGSQDVKSAQAVVDWGHRNAHAINDYWVKDKAGAHEIKKRIEAAGEHAAREATAKANAEAAASAAEASQVAAE